MKINSNRILKKSKHFFYHSFLKIKTLFSISFERIKIIDKKWLIGIFITLLFGSITFHNDIKQLFTPNINGEWIINFEILESSYTPYIGLKTEYKIFINSNKNSVTGIGEKWSENGIVLNYDLHTKIELEGNINGKDLNLLYKLHGKKRESSGNIKTIITGNKIGGFFSGSGANVKGKVYGFKITNHESNNLLP